MINEKRQSEVNAKLLSLLQALASQLEDFTVDMIQELVSSNESPVALEMLCDMLAEGGASVSYDVMADLESLARELNVNESVSQSLASIRVV